MEYKISQVLDLLARLGGVQAACGSLVEAAGELNTLAAELKLPGQFATVRQAEIDAVQVLLNRMIQNGETVLAKVATIT